MYISRSLLPYLSRFTPPSPAPSLPPSLSVAAVRYKCYVQRFALTHFRSFLFIFFLVWDPFSFNIFLATVTVCYQVYTRHILKTCLPLSSQCLPFHYEVHKYECFFAPFTFPFSFVFFPSLLGFFPSVFVRIVYFIYLFIFFPTTGRRERPSPDQALLYRARDGSLGGQNHGKTPDRAHAGKGLALMQPWVRD